MIFKFKMTSTKNIFSILESYWSHLSPHIVFILKTSCYVSFRALSKITAEKILDIQKFIQALFSDQTLTEELSKEGRISQFGPLYWKKPEKFMFALGDIDSILVSRFMNLETKNWRISNVTRHVLVSITLISSLILTYKPSLYCFIFIYSRIYTTKPDKTVKDVVIIVNNLWRGLCFHNLVPPVEHVLTKTRERTKKKTQAIPHSPQLRFQTAAPTVKQSWKNCRSRGRSAQSRSFQYDGGANTIFRTEIVR